MDIWPNDRHAPTIGIASGEGIGIAVRPLQGGDAVAGFRVGDVSVGDPVGDHFPSRVGHAELRILAFAAGKQGHSGDGEQGRQGQFHERMLSGRFDPLKKEGGWTRRIYMSREAGKVEAGAAR